MANKKIPTPVAESEIKAIGLSPYVILPDNTIARKLKPTLIKGQPKWNLCISAGKTIRVGVEDVSAFLAALDQANADKPETPPPLA